MNIILKRYQRSASRFGFASQQYDLVIIGGGPGGMKMKYILKVMLLLLKHHS